MGMSQNFVDLADVAGKLGGWIKTRQPAAGRTSAPERRDAPEPAGSVPLPASIKVFILRACGVRPPRLPAGKTPGLPRQVVERGGQCGEAEAKTRGVDRVVGR